MAQGIKAGISVRSPKIWGNELEKDGVAWTAAKWYMPTLSLVIVSAEQRTFWPHMISQRGLRTTYESEKPNTFRLWLRVMVLATKTTLS